VHLGVVFRPAAEAQKVNLGPRSARIVSRNRAVYVILAQPEPDSRLGIRGVNHCDVLDPVDLKLAIRRSRATDASGNILGDTVAVGSPQQRRLAQALAVIKFDPVALLAEKRILSSDRIVVQIP